jgi:dihydrofolate reductase
VREFVADLFISVDGFASGNNEAAFLGCFGPELSAWISDHLNQPQIVVMGRVTYNALAAFSEATTDPNSLRMASLTKLVFSSTLSGPPQWQNSHIVKTSAETEIRNLKQQQGETLRSIGSISLVRSLIKAGLVDRLRLMIFPLVLGTTGKEPIFAAYERQEMQLMDEKVLDSRLIVLEYRLGSSKNE